ncbi:hypothetical protein ACMAZF_19735 [Psychrobium sp. nBUS_13]|uniref:hypothetical protein n=1 Tax=Psychrobium sp. nBUS_13 TaxID=3395319 RepID=UPI003EBCA991
MNGFLIAAAVGNGLAALLHVGCIIFGASWYRFFGAGEQMAAWAEQGSMRPTIITSFIVIVLCIFSMYALSAANVIRKLPLLKIGLVGITSLFLIRGVGGLFLISSVTEQGSSFGLWSSVICLFYGMLHLMGLRQYNARNAVH